jgi:hypothetical protein
MMTVEVASAVAASSRINLLRPFIPVPPAHPGRLIYPLTGANLAAAGRCCSLRQATLEIYQIGEALAAPPIPATLVHYRVDFIFNPN